MEIRFTPLDLASLDGLKTEALCIWLFSDERPLRGAAGLVDWRLCGRLSQLLLRGTIAGERGEALLMPPPEKRLLAERLLLLGAGKRAELDASAFRACLRELVARVLALHARSFALSLPHASLSWLDPAQAIDLLLEATRDVSAQFEELVLVDGREAVRAMEPRIERARRRALAEP